MYNLLQHKHFLSNSKSSSFRGDAFVEGVGEGFGWKSGGKSVAVRCFSYTWLHPQFPSFASRGERLVHVFFKCCQDLGGSLEMIEWGFSILFKVQILKYLTAACFLAELSNLWNYFLLSLLRYSWRRMRPVHLAVSMNFPGVVVARKVTTKQEAREAANGLSHFSGCTINYSCTADWLHFPKRIGADGDGDDHQMREKLGPSNGRVHNTVYGLNESS